MVSRSEPPLKQQFLVLADSLSESRTLVGDRTNDMESAEMVRGSSKENPVEFLDDENDESLVEIFAPAQKVSKRQNRKGSRELSSLKHSRLKESILAVVERKEERSILGKRKLSSSRASWGKRPSSTGDSEREESLSIQRAEVNEFPSARELTEPQKKLLTVQEAGGLLLEDSPLKAGPMKARPRVMVGSAKTASETKRSNPLQATLSDFPGSCVALSKRKEPNGKSVTGRIGWEASTRPNGVVAKSALGGPCCECAGKMGIVGYTGEYGPRTLCHRCYNRRRRPGKAGKTKPALRASEEPLKIGKKTKPEWAGPCRECKRKASLGWYKSAHGPRSLCKTCYHRLWRRKRAEERQAESTRFKGRKESHVSDLRTREEGRGGGSIRNESKWRCVNRPGKATNGIGEANFNLPRTNGDWERQGERASDGRRSDATEKRGDLGSEKRTYFVPRIIKAPAHIEKESSIGTGRGFSAKEGGKEGGLDGETGHMSLDASMEEEQDAAEHDTAQAASPEILEPDILEILSRFGRKEMIQEQNKVLKERKEAAEFSRKQHSQKDGDGNGCGQHGSQDVGGDPFVPRRSDRVAVSATRRRMVRAMEWTGEKGGERARARRAIFARESVADLESFVGAKGVGFGDCFAFDEFLADCGSRQAKQIEDDSGKGAEGRESRDAQLGKDAEGEAAEQGKRVEDPLLAQIWSECDLLMQDDKEEDASAGHRHDRSCLYFDLDYGRFCTVDFFGERIQDNGRQYRADYDWMGRLLPGWWKRKEPPPGIAETFQPKKRRRLMLEDLPEAPHSQARARTEHCAAVRAAEQRSPSELVAAHGSAARAAFWAVLGPTRQPFQSQVEGFEFIMKNLTGSVDGLGSQAGSAGGAGKRAAKERERFSEGGAFGSSGKGCIAAHAPGTGKTMLGWAVFWWFQRLKSTRLMTLAPASVLHVWEDQKPVSMNTYRLDAPSLIRASPSAHPVAPQKEGKNLVRRLSVLREAAEKKDGMVLLSYELARDLLNGQAGSASLREELTWLLLEAPDVVLFDEGHNMRNEDSQLFDILQRTRTPLRVLFTGTPANNTFEEICNLLHFAQPETLIRWAIESPSHQGGTPPTEPEARRAFLKDFQEPLNQLLKSSELTKRRRKRMKRILQGLKRLMGDVLQWRPGAGVAPEGCALAFTDKTVTLDMASAQSELYWAYVRVHVGKNRVRLRESFRLTERGGTETEAGSGTVERGGDSEKHREEVIVPLPEEEEGGIRAKASEWDLGLEGKAERGSGSSQKDSHLSHEHRLGFVCAHPAAFARQYKETYKALLAKETALLDLSADVSDVNSCKSQFLTLLLDRLKDTGRFVVFGENVAALRTIAEGLASRFDWELDREILYIDGKLSQNARRERRDRFNDPRSGAVVLLATVDTCDEGIDLSGATHVVLWAPLWNPMQTRQLIGRVVRPGQTAHVYIYRLVCRGTWEETIHQRAVRKEQTGRILFPLQKAAGDRAPDVLGCQDASKSVAGRVGAFLHDLEHQGAGAKGKGLVAKVEDYEGLFQGGFWAA